MKIGPHADDFDWRVFADATCAGLSALIPLPLVDVAFEAVFRRRMPGTIANARHAPMAQSVRLRLGRGSGGALSLAGCLGVPIAIARYILRKLWRKIIYFFTVADATSSLAEYWHRAYLLDHAIRAGHFGPGADTELALRVFQAVLSKIDPSPLMGLARQTVTNAQHVMRLMIRARRLGASQVTQSLEELVASQWQGVETSLEATAVEYNAAYRAATSPREST